jgi:hypothetical protein
LSDWTRPDSVCCRGGCHQTGQFGEDQNAGIDSGDDLAARVQSERAEETLVYEFGAAAGPADDKDAVGVRSPGKKLM